MPLRAAYWFCFVLALGVYGLMVGWSLPGIAASAGGLPPFDLRPAGYSPDEARAFLAALGPEGRALYAGPQKLLDLIYPALLAIVLKGAVCRFFRAGPLRTLLFCLVLLGMAGDYTENLLVSQMLAADPSDRLIGRASMATQVKSLATTVVMVGLAWALVRAGVQTWKARH